MNTLFLPELREMLAEDRTDELREFCTALHPARTAEFMEGLDNEEIWRVLQHAQPSLQAEVFQYFDFDRQVELIASQDEKQIAVLVTQLPADDAVDLLRKVPDTRVDTILALAGTDQATSGQTPRLYLAETDQSVVAERKPGMKRVAIQPGASHGYKQYPDIAWKSLIQSIRTIGADVYLVGGPEEQSAVESVNNLLGERPATSLVGKTSLRSLMATLNAFDLVISADTGVSHVAAAVGTPTITLFGPTPIHKWGRNYPPHRALQAPDADMGKLSPDMVAAVVQEQLA